MKLLILALGHGTNGAAVVDADDLNVVIAHERNCGLNKARGFHRRKPASEARKPAGQPLSFLYFLSSFSFFLCIQYLVCGYSQAGKSGSALLFCHTGANGDSGVPSERGFHDSALRPRVPRVPDGPRGASCPGR